VKRKLNISGSPVLGVFATCTDEFVFVPYESTPETIGELEESLGVVAAELR